MLHNKIYIGTAGWNYKDWEGIVYPSVKGKQFDQLSYLAQYFNTIEINSSFYRAPSASAAASWVDRVSGNSDFLFTYKLWQGFTHHREMMPGDQDEKLAKQGLDILRANERLGATLMQFPWSFKNTTENQDWLHELILKFNDYYPVIEVRHNSWNDATFIAALDNSGAAFANIDQPAIGQSLGLTNYAGQKLSYLRLHGRNYSNWFANDASVASRYDYLYSDDELHSIQTTIENLIKKSRKTFIIFNNHFVGKAVANALQFMVFMGGATVKAPAPLLQAYPQLRHISINQDETVGQRLLFSDE